MREGGMAVISLAVVADHPATRIEDKRIRPYREPAPGEMYAYIGNAFTRLQALVRREGLGIVTDRQSLAAASGAHPAVIVTSEGGDFLEGSADRVDEAHERWQLRQLQLTHYRVNELGDIQTEPRVHGGLTDSGVAVIRRCNRRGIVVDVAHGPYELVKRAAEVTEKPLVLSHTSLNPKPARFSRTISPDHARIIAETGGVIGIWPPTTIFPDMTALAEGIARMVDVAGIAHVGLGSDMMGLLSPAAFHSYSQLPELSGALLARGFSAEETVKLLGGNAARVFGATLT
jgi:membrane dipeptidase